MMPSTRSKTKQRDKNQNRGQRAEGRVRQDFSFTFEAIGTHWKVELFGVGVKKNLVHKQVMERIEEFDKTYSRFREDSLVTKMSQVAGEYVLPKDAKPIMDAYRDLYELTNGLVTPLIGQALSDAGYDAEYSFKSRGIAAVPRWDDVIEYDFPRLHMKKPALLDFGALGKGYLIDIIGELLGHQCNDFIINAGGDILHHGGAAIEIALENPSNTSEAIGIATIKDQAICGSAGNRRIWAGYNHILNPVTASSPKHIAAVWAVAKSAMLADAITTALYFADPTDLLKRYTFSYGIISADYSLAYSPDFPVSFFNSESK